MCSVPNSNGLQWGTMTSFINNTRRVSYIQRSNIYKKKTFYTNIIVCAEFLRVLVYNEVRWPAPLKHPLRVLFSKK